MNSPARRLDGAERVVQDLQRLLPDEQLEEAALDEAPERGHRRGLGPRQLRHVEDRPHWDAVHEVHVPHSPALSLKRAVMQIFLRFSQNPRVKDILINRILMEYFKFYKFVEKFIT